MDFAVLQKGEPMNDLGYWIKVFKIFGSWECSKCGGASRLKTRRCHICGCEMINGIG